MSGKGKGSRAASGTPCHFKYRVLPQPLPAHKSPQSFVTALLFENAIFGLLRKLETQAERNVQIGPEVIKLFLSSSQLSMKF